MAAATSTRDFPDVGGGLKCGKCRSTTLVRKGQFLEDTEDSNLWTLDQDHLPEWIQTAVDESGWTKGRIACPNCQCRIGAFDFVGGADNPVHLVKSKVDRSIGSTESSEITQTLEKRTAAAAAGAAAAAAAPLTPETTAIPAAVATSSSTEGDTISVTAPESKSLALEVTSSAVAASATAEVTSSDTTDTSSMAMPLVADQHQPITMSDNDNDDEDANAVLPSVSLTTGNGSEAVADDVIGEEDDVHDEEPFEDASGNEEDEDVDATEADVVQMDFLVDGASGDMRLLSAASTTAEAAAAAAAASAGNRRAIKRSKMTLGQVGSHKKSLMKTKQEREEKFIQEILNSEPELDDMDPSLICPVCLDLLHDPYSALPCKHTFCETCLRRLGSKNAMDTTCPMCRQRILFCDLQSDLSKTIKLQFPEMYEKRKKFERSSANGNLSVYNMPLPWRPGWRNLISGRPMGGNAFDTRGSTAELFRRVVQQLPYYIPPVVLANLINLVFFVFLLFAVEVVPTLISLLMKTKKSSLPNVALQPPPPPAASFNPADKSAGAVGGANGAAAAGSSTVSVADAAAAAAAAAAQAIHGDAIGASGEIQDYEDGSVDVATTSAAALDESILSAAAAAAASAVSASSASGSSDLPDDGQGFFPHSGDGIGGGGGGGVGIGPGGGGVDGSISNGMVMDTTFYYALYLVLFAGTLLGNFFLLNHPTSLIPRGSILERWFYHPRWGRFNRRVFDVLLVLLLTSIPIVTLPLVFSSSSSMMTSPAQGGVAAAEATIATMTSSTTSSSSSKTLLDAWLTRLVDYCTAFFAFPYFFVGIAVVWMVSVYFFDCHDDPVE